MMRGKSRTQLLVPYTPRADLLEVPPEPCRSSNLYFRTQPKARPWDPHGEAGKPCGEELRLWRQTALALSLTGLGASPCPFLSLFLYQ